MKNKLLIIVLIFGLCIMGGCKEKENKTTSENEETDIGYTTDQLEAVPLEQADVGDVIQLGHMEQDGDETTSAEPLYWDVLDKKDNKILVISHYVICRHQFSETKENEIWEESDLRKYLNGQFYDETFDEEEKNKIVDSVISNPSIKQYLVTLEKDEWTGILDDMPDTTDKLFALSWEEVIQYYQPEIKINECGIKYYASDILLAKPTYVVLIEDYEQRQKKVEELTGHGDGIYKTEGVAWLSRSQGIFEESVLYVDHKGNIGGTSPSSTSDCGVRPAMWIEVQ